MTQRHSSDYYNDRRRVIKDLVALSGFVGGLFALLPRASASMRASLVDGSIDGAVARFAVIALGGALLGGALGLAVGSALGQAWEWLHRRSR